MEQNGWIRSEWVRTATNRKAKFYRLSPSGKHLAEVEKSFSQLVHGVQSLMQYA